MYIRRCDRCGKMQETPSLAPVFTLGADAMPKLPRYSISVMDDGVVSQLYLCDDCCKAMDDFLVFRRAKKEHSMLRAAEMDRAQTVAALKSCANGECKKCILREACDTLEKEYDALMLRAAALLSETEAHDGP